MMAETIDHATGELMEAPGGVLPVLAHRREDVDIQVATAKQYPRSISHFQSQALGMVTYNEEIAGGCLFALPRAGKTIEGPSVRLAEIAASAWGNLRVQARPTSTDDKYVYAESVAWDLETNTAIRIENRRRITNRNGERYNDDMIAMTANAAASVALRNAIFRVIPRVYIDVLYAAARLTAVGNAQTLTDKRAKMMDHFQKSGVTEERVLARMGKPSVEDIDLDNLTTLKGLATAIKDGATSVDSAFPEVKDEPPETGGKADFGFKKKAKAKKAKKTAKTKPEEPKVEKPSEEPDPATKAEAERQKAKLLDEIEQAGEALPESPDNPF